MLPFNSTTSNSWFACYPYIIYIQVKFHGVGVVTLRIIFSIIPRFLSTFSASRNLPNSIETKMKEIWMEIAECCVIPLNIRKYPNSFVLSATCIVKFCMRHFISIRNEIFRTSPSDFGFTIFVDAIVGL